MSLWPLKRYSLICNLLDSQDINVENYMKLKFLIEYFGISICSFNCLKKIKEKICSMASLNEFHNMLIGIIDGKIL